MNHILKFRKKIVIELEKGLHNFVKLSIFEYEKFMLRF